ncbi:MAG: hypothetical protein BWZ06_01789 [Bacteroidetes bacterium ADurb.BinA261]|nr:MAG: hypothetical protein BWZ06_01789 [Bacteroidetes bacterium ADurb.BinA261]
MHERDGAGMQTDAAIGIGTFGSIFQIAFDGATNFCQLATNLMMTAGLEINFKQKIFLRSCYQLVMKNRFFGIRLFRIVGCRFVGFFVFYQVMNQCVFILGRPIFDNSPIGFIHFAVAKHLIQARKCFARFSKNHHPACRSIEAVGNAAKNITRFVVFFFQIFFNQFRKRFIAGFVALHNFRRCFIDDNEMIVFVENIHNLQITNKMRHKDNRCASRERIIYRDY